jgi:hypothetical protein
MKERSPVTMIPVLVGFAPGVTVTVRSVVPPGWTELGVAAPVPLGFVVVRQGLAAVAVLRGAGAPAAKSPELLSVSVQPFEARRAAVVLESVAAGALPSKQFAAP